MRIEILIVETRGSAPREAGTRMWVGATEIAGSIGGGNLEYTALKIAREMLLSSRKQRERKFALGDSLGQCCGGSVTLRFTKRIRNRNRERTPVSTSSSSAPATSARRSRASSSACPAV